MYQNPELTQQLSDLRQADLRRVVGAARTRRSPDALRVPTLRLGRPLARLLGH